MKELEIELLWLATNLNNEVELTRVVEAALKRWNIKPDTKDYTPEHIVLHLSYKETLKVEEIFGLEVVFEKTIPKKHLKIRGTLY